MADGRLQNVLFTQCNLRLAGLGYTMKKYVHFIECLLIEVDFYHSKWSNIFFEKCELTGANLLNTRLKGIDLSDYADSTSLVRGQTDLKRTISNLFSLNANYNFGVDILSTDKTITYVPLTMDVFTDDFHLNYRGRETDNPDVTEEEIIEFIMLFDKFKTLNDIVLHNDLFLDFNDGT